MQQFLNANTFFKFRKGEWPLYISHYPGGPIKALLRPIKFLSAVKRGGKKGSNDYPQESKNFCVYRPPKRYCSL